MITRKKKCFFFLFLLVMNSLLLYPFSQKDSLVGLFNQTPRIKNEDFSKALLIVYDLSDNGFHDKTEELAYLMFNEALAKKSLERQARVYFLLAYNNSNKGLFKKALIYYDKSLLIRKKIGDRKGVGDVYSNISNIYYDMGNYKEALICQKKSLAISFELKDVKGVADSYGTIGNILSDQKNYNESLIYYRKSFKLSLKIKDSLNLSNIAISMGHIKFERMEYDSAYYYYNHSLSYSLPHNKYSMCYAYRGIGSVFLKEKKFEQSEFYLKKSFAIANDIKVPLEVTLSELSLAQLYLSAGKPEKAEELLNKTLLKSKELEFTKGIFLSHELLSQAYDNMKNFKLSLAHYKEYKKIHDSISLLEEKKIINELQTKIKIDEETHKIKTEYTEQENKFILFIVISIFLILFISTYFYYKSVSSKKKFNLKLQKLELKAQERLLMNINNERKRISQDVHDDLGSSITGMQIFTEMVAAKTKNAELKNDMDKLLFMQKEITFKVREIIWFVRNEDNLLENLVRHCKNYSENIFLNFPINIHFVSSESFSNIKISESDRKQFFLSYKEALNNVIKHSKAKDTFINFELKESTFTIQIKDNGKGFNTKTISHYGFGLKNITSRMKSIGGRTVIESNQKGTLIILEKDYPDLSN